jgi:hypothetical protein
VHTKDLLKSDRGPWWVGALRMSRSVHAKDLLKSDRGP